MIYIGNNELKEIYVGDTHIVSGFIGDTPFWGEEEPPVENKAIVTTTGGTIVYIPKTGASDVSIEYGEIDPEAAEVVVVLDGVTTIGNMAFERCYNLTAVTLPNSLTTIQDSAFYECGGLQSITLPSGVTTIGMDAFCMCSSLSSITLSNAVTSIGAGAFAMTAIEEITIPSGVTVISSVIFNYCGSLTSVTLPSGITEIQDYAFNECSALPSLQLPAALTVISGGAFAGCSSLSDIGVVPSGVTSIGDEVFYGCESLAVITFAGLTPATLGFDTFGNVPLLMVPCDAVDAYKAAWSAYEDRINCQRAIIVPDITIYYAKNSGDETDFYVLNPALVSQVSRFGIFNENWECEEYNIPADGTFPYNGDGSLTVGLILTSSTQLDTALFDGTDFSEIDASTASYTRIFNSTSSLTSNYTDSGEYLVNLPHSVLRIEDCALSGTAVSVLNEYGGFESGLPSGLTYIGDYAMSEGSFNSSVIEIPSSVTHIGEGAFSEAMVGYDFLINSRGGIPDYFNQGNTITMGRLTVGTGNTSIGTAAFRNDVFTELVLPNNLQSIGNQAFAYTNMYYDEYNPPSGITFPASLTSIGSDAFKDAYIPAFYFEGTTPPTLGAGAFSGCIADSGGTNVPTPIYVPCEAVDTYKAATGWSDFANQITCNEVDPSTEYFHFISLADGSQVKANSKFSYSLDGGNTWTAGDNQMKTLASGATIHFKGNNSTAIGGEAFGLTNNLSTSRLEVRGNIMSLVYGDLFQNYNVLPCDGVFKNLLAAQYTSPFSNPTLIKAHRLVLPSTALTSHCYERMFFGCINLQTAPSLPATSLASSCYTGLFQGCKHLTAAPSLPATSMTESCYQDMFNGCSSLTSAPSLPATVLADSCYFDMFNGCSSLTVAPDLPAPVMARMCYARMLAGTSIVTAPVLSATTLASSCYSLMMAGCYSLTTASELPATSLTYSCYDGMYQYCSGLTSAPDLPAETLDTSCYRKMFYSCTSLNHIKAMFTTTPSNDYMEDWVTNVFPVGTFVKNASATYDTSLLGLPNAWTITDA